MKIVGTRKSFLPTIIPSNVTRHFKNTLAFYAAVGVLHQQHPPYAVFAGEEHLRNNSSKYYKTF